MNRANIFHLLLLIITLPACNMDFPGDPNGTLNSVHGSTLRLGIVSNAPWVYIEDGEPHGIEYELVQQMAEDLDASIVWTQGSETEILEALEVFKLDLAIGGFIQGRHAPHQVALTLPYFSENIVIADKGNTILDNLEGQAIYVEFGSAHIAWLENHDAIPRIIQTLSLDHVPAIMPETLAIFWNLSISDHIVTTHQRIMMVPPGENRWLDYVEKFLLALNEEALAQQIVQEVEP